MANTKNIPANHPLKNHDYVILGKKHYILSAYTSKKVNNILFDVEGYEYGANVVSCVFQEVKDGECIFEWNSTDHPKLYAATKKLTAITLPVTTNKTEFYFRLLQYAFAAAFLGEYMKSSFLYPVFLQIKQKGRYSLILAISTVSVLLCGCGRVQADKPVEATSFKLNTIVRVTLYDAPDDSLAEESLKLCDKYEAVFSRTLKDSELYKLNHRELPALEGSPDTYQVSQPLAELLSIGLEYTKASDGAFNIAIAPLTSLWDFTAEAPQVPDSSEISQAVTACSYQGISIDGQNVTLQSPDTQFDLGAIAKGYIADRIKDYLVSKGVKSAIINLGGNVVCIGEKTEGVPFHIGVQKPFADRSETIATMDIKDKTVVSSGIYERCFEKDGTLYHHLLNPQNGFPYDNDLIAVTIITDHSVDGDALSTTCFALGCEKGLAYAQSLDNVQAIFITRDYQVHYTENFEKEINITASQKNN